MIIKKKKILIIIKLLQFKFILNLIIYIFDSDLDNIILI